MLTPAMMLPPTTATTTCQAHRFSLPLPGTHHMSLRRSPPRPSLSLATTPLTRSPVRPSRGYVHTTGHAAGADVCVCLCFLAVGPRRLVWVDIQAEFRAQEGGNTGPVQVLGRWKYRPSSSPRKVEVQVEFKAEGGNTGRVEVLGRWKYKPGSRPRKVGSVLGKVQR